MRADLLLLSALALYMAFQFGMSLLLVLTHKSGDIPAWVHPVRVLLMLLEGVLAVGAVRLALGAI